MYSCDANRQPSPYGKKSGNGIFRTEKSGMYFLPNMFNVNVAIDIIVLSNRTLFNVVIREGCEDTPFRLNNKLGKKN